MYTKKSGRKRHNYLKSEKGIILSYSVRVNSVLGISDAQDRGPTSISAIPIVRRASAGTNWRNVEHSSNWMTPKSHLSYLCAGRVFLTQEKEKEKCPGTKRRKNVTLTLRAPGTV